LNAVAVPPQSFSRERWNGLGRKLTLAMPYPGTPRFISAVDPFISKGG
jgi:hypothetical protein